MIRYIYFLLLGVFLMTAPAATDPKENARRGFESQMAAWNRGDLEAALQTYWNSPNMTWVNKSGIQHGFAEFANAMRSDFANEPSKMGRYEGDILEARNLGPDTALIVVKWSISKDGKRMMGGISTQIWRILDDHSWRCVFEHAS